MHKFCKRTRPTRPLLLALFCSLFVFNNSVTCEAQSPKNSSVKTSIRNERKLTSRPVGRHVFKFLAECEDHEAIAPGATIDIELATIGDEGAKSKHLLNEIKVYSIGQWYGGGVGVADDEAKVDPNEPASDDPQESSPNGNQSDDDEEVIPLCVVGVFVNNIQLETLRMAQAQGMLFVHPSPKKEQVSMVGEIWSNFTTNLFQPLLLFFFLGFAVPLLKVPLEFPKQLYQSLTIYLLLAIGWHGGELMAQQKASELAVAGGLVVVGFIMNGVIGILATKILQWFTPMRKIDSVTVGAYYGSDSAGTFVTCLGILATLGILHDSYMPVMLAVMEIPGCLVGLFLVSHLRNKGMDAAGNMPGEAGYSGAVDDGSHKHSVISWKIFHEVFLNPGLFLLFGGIIVGFISGLQAAKDPHVVEGPNHLFVFIFKGALCLFLLEMGMTACRRLSDLKTAGPGFILFGLLAPNLFAVMGMFALHGYSMAIGHHFYLGTYALMAVLCGAASYIAVPAVQRLAIPEASPTLPLAASLGLTFTWNVTLGIPIYIQIAKSIVSAMPIA